MAFTLPQVHDRAFAIDALTIVVLSAGICVAADALAFMSVFVPTLLVLRFVLLGRLTRAERGYGMKVELAFFALCTILGAFNDWNSVVRHQIYDYDVPVYFPEFSTIPLWMLLSWGMILRLFFTLSRWDRLGPPAALDDRIHGGVARSSNHAALRVAILLALALGTRPLIYRFYADPWLSWTPFAAALVIYGLLLRPQRHDLRLVAAFALGGPAIEILFIQVGGLHHYPLGWIAGVPLWIVLWWMLAVLVWKDLGGRIFAWLCRSRLGGTDAPRVAPPYPPRTQAIPPPGPALSQWVSGSAAASCE